MSRCCGQPGLGSAVNRSHFPDFPGFHWRKQVRWPRERAGPLAAAELSQRSSMPLRSLQPLRDRLQGLLESLPIQQGVRRPLVRTPDLG